MQARITTDTVDKILKKEIKVKEKAKTTKETFEAFLAHQKKAQVDQDEPQLSVGGMLDKNFGYILLSFWICDTISQRIKGMQKMDQSTQREAIVGNAV